MAKWSIMVLSALLGCSVAEPPSGYSYSAPSPLVIIGGGHGGHGGHESHGSALSHGGPYSPVPVGHQESEGYHIDPHLLEKIRHIILKDEIQNQAYQNAASSHGHGVSSHYGPPAPVYGVPHDRIVGVELDHLQQAIQVAQYHSAEEGYSGGGHYAGGYASYSHAPAVSYSAPSVSYSAPSVSYSAPSVAYSAPSHAGPSYTTIGVPSGSYGVPAPSSSYGSPHH